jgi:hypothetical protein
MQSVRILLGDGMQIEDDLPDGPGARVGRLVFLVAVDDQAVVPADVHAGG